MKRRYSSFLIRCWLLDSGEQRIKIEHIQSGKTTQLASPAAALAWIHAHRSEFFGEQFENQCEPDAVERTPGDLL